MVFKLEKQKCAEWVFYVAVTHLDDPPVSVGSTGEHMTPADWNGRPTPSPGSCCIC